MNNEKHNVNDFNDFLKSDNIFEDFYNSDDKRIFVVKVPYNSKIDILYSIRSYNGEVFDLYSNLEYSGFYDKINDKMFDLNYTISREILGWDFSKNTISKSKICNEINNVVGKRVKELVEEEKDNLFGKDFIPPEINEYCIPTERDTNIHFIDGVTSKTLENQFRNYSTNSSKKVLEYITDSESFVEEEARDYILDHLNDIYIGLFQSEEQRRLLKEIEEDKNNPIHRIKAIIDSIKDKDYKTVNITINKEGIEQTFKYYTFELLSSYNSSYLSTYYFVSARERLEFEENFGRSADLYYKDIVKITHGKNIIFDDSKDKDKEENICL